MSATAYIKLDIYRLSAEWLVHSKRLRMLKNVIMSLFGILAVGLLGALFGGITSGLSSSVSTSLSGGLRRQKKLMNYQDKINDENYERERLDKLEDYQRTLNDQKLLIEDERQYNSIGSVMQRARDANISPLAALGVSSGNTLASVSPPQGTSSQGVSQPADTSASRSQAAMAAISTLQDMKIQREKLKIEKDLAQAEIDKKNAETKSINERLPFISQEAQETVNNLVREGKYKEAQEVLAKAETALKEQQYEQKEEMFDYEKRESASRTNLNNANANKTSFEDWYQRTHHRPLSSGLSHFIDVLMDSVGGKTPVLENAIDEVTDGKGLIKGAKNGLFSFLNKYVPYLSDQALKEYVDVLWDYLQTINFRSMR